MLMKKMFIHVLLGFLLVACNKTDSELSPVDSFMNSLKKGKSESFEIPNFTNEDITDLLNHRNDEDKISNFPRNPLSSFYMEEVSIGMYALWNIEAIRMKEIESPDFYLYASLNPRIAKINSGEICDQDEILPKVAVAYLNWWNSSLPLEEKLQINPLEALNLRWN